MLMWEFWTWKPEIQVYVFAYFSVKVAAWAHVAAAGVFVALQWRLMWFFFLLIWTTVLSNINFWLDAFSWLLKSLPSIIVCKFFPSIKQYTPTQHMLVWSTEPSIVHLQFYVYPRSTQMHNLTSPARLSVFQPVTSCPQKHPCVPANGTKTKHFIRSAVSVTLSQL